MTRDAATAELLAELGKNPRVWRDYINFIHGLNVGMDAARREQVRTGHLVSADELYAEDAPPIHDRVQAIVAQTRAEAGDERSIGPAELLSAIFISGARGIAAGTARWLGLTAALGARPQGCPPHPAHCSRTSIQPHSHAPIHAARWCCWAVVPLRPKRYRPRSTWPT